MGFKSHQTSKTHSCLSLRPTTIVSSVLLITSFFLLLSHPPNRLTEPRSQEAHLQFYGDLREARFAWNRLCFGPISDKLKLAVFSKKWPIGAVPGGMERHAHTLFSELAARGHEVHVFTVPSDRQARPDVVHGSLHLHFASNDAGSLNCSLAVETFHRENDIRPFDYVHTESVSLPPWRAKNVPNVAATWHGIWYEIMHSTLFEDLLWEPRGPSGSDPHLHEAMPRLVDEIRFFSSYKQHICISDSAGEILANIYQLHPRNVHVILNGVDHTKFVHDPESGAHFRRKHGVPTNVSLVMGVAGRLVRDKGHPLLYEAFSAIRERYPGVLLLVAGSGPWARRYEELHPQVKVVGALGPSELSEFYNAVDVFVNPTVRPQGLDLTLIEAMHCGKPLLTTNFPSIKGTVVVHDGLGYTFAPNVRSLIETLEWAIRDGPVVLREKGMACKAYALSMFTATKMASAYERFFFCMKNSKYCQYPLPSDC
ncbi:uncharacterized protein LOC131238744 [Magnolia sinica]|uniref:uncharacterized protein LOC131238744 n=1 Tax=Magnolia sinica TaxID=86752 RepID=UPI002659E075|nr:uncharacterized protein LOC131238744 [Magnolia sinica]